MGCWYIRRVMVESDLAMAMSFLMVGMVCSSSAQGPSCLANRMMERISEEDIIDNVFLRKDCFGGDSV